MLKRIQKNTGMSLVEVLVSMLVLSIAVVTVMTTFSMATKVNVKTKEAQSQESLMENLLEYTEAGGTDYETWFVPIVTGTPTSYTLVSEDADIKVEKISNIQQGFHTYDVEIITNKKPTGYTSADMNDHKVIQFGGSGSNTLSINASTGTNLAAADTSAYNAFWTRFVAYVMEHDEAERVRESMETLAGGPVTPAEIWLPSNIPSMYPQSATDMSRFVDRELWITTVAEASDQMRIQPKLVYKIDSGVPFPAAYADPSMRRHEINLIPSGLYDVGSSTDPSAVKLDQIYIYYSKETDVTQQALGDQIDIRILDGQSATDKLLKANVYIALQETSDVNLTGATFDPMTQKLHFYGNGAGFNIDSGNRDIRISTKNPETGADMRPIEMKVYSSADIEYNDGGTGVVIEGSSLVAKGEEVRVVEVTLNIMEPGTTTVLETETVTRLQ